jgi:hypothetical protein
MKWSLVGDLALPSPLQSRLRIDYARILVIWPMLHRIYHFCVAHPFPPLARISHRIDQSARFVGGK